MLQPAQGWRCPCWHLHALTAALLCHLLCLGKGKQAGDVVWPGWKLQEVACTTRAFSGTHKATHSF